MDIKDEPIDPEEYEAKTQKAKEIIGQEFKREVEERENEVIEIQDRIQTVQRYIELLKYVGSHEFYDQKDDVPNNEENDRNIQKAIHPCVKKFLPPLGVEAPVKSEAPEDESVCTKNVTIQKPVAKPNLTIVRGTYKIKHHFIVGNVSKWIPPSFREDEATHKWMLYIRDKGRDDDLANVLKKVRYYLHESYKPHDIIDVTSSPFHLTRRGWGEFPVRVTLYFQHSSNKPVDVKHDLRLDHTFSGLQMLGGETVFEIDLIHHNMDQFINENSVDEKTDSVSEPTKIFSTKLEECIANEHDYCTTGVKKEIDHSFSNYQDQVSSLVDTIKVSEMEILDTYDGDGGLISEWYRNNLLKRMSNIIFLSTEACVKWVLKRWPLVTSNALMPKYKIVHPYVFPSMTDYLKANIGKKRAAEWFRAYKIKHLIQNLKLAPWSTKQIMLYARMHGYVNFIGKSYNTEPSKFFKNVCTYTNVLNTSRDLRQMETSVVDKEIDIVGDVPEKTLGIPFKALSPVKVVSNWIKCVDCISRDIGIRLGDEELVEGVTINAPSVLIAHVFKLFLEDLLRKSSCNAWLRNKCRNPGTLEVADIVKTLMESPHFDVLTNSGLGSKTDNTHAYLLLFYVTFPLT